MASQSPKKERHSSISSLKSPRDVPDKTEQKHVFQAKRPARHLDRLKKKQEAQGIEHEELQELFLGVAAEQRESGNVEVGFCVHDGTYSIDFAVETFQVEDGIDINSRLADFVLDRVEKYEEDHKYKFMGVGVSVKTDKLSPLLAPRLWTELDIVPVIISHGGDSPDQPAYELEVDEEADSMARKCIMRFGPLKQPMLQVGFLNMVDVDAGHLARLTTLEQYRVDVGERTWKATMHYAKRLKERNISIAFFNSTPQGGGVALMRHALVRFMRLLGVKMRWYIPMPKPEVFRITKTNHNILQGVADPEERLNDDQASTLWNWSEHNAQRFWLRKGGPLSAVKDGGANFVVIDDPQMPNLVALAKKADPDRPVIFRSHIQIRSDLVDEKKGSPTAHVFDWLYQQVKDADMFVSHPVKAFVPKAVKPETVAYLPATTDWYDGLNKDMREYDLNFYLHQYNKMASSNDLPVIDSRRPYIVQIARFDPSKGIPDVVESYGILRRQYYKDTPVEETPQLVIAGHGAIDDPDASRIFDETIGQIERDYPELQKDVSIMRLGPTDQLLNMLMSNARVALQLSTREGFEVKVSEALHKGVPVIASKAGGIPLQVADGKSGFLVEPGDNQTVAKHLHELLTDDQLYEDMSKYAAKHVSDEVGTVGNALAWLYLADVTTDKKEDRVVPNGRWVNDMAREHAQQPYEEGEPRLPRHLST